MFHLSFQLFHEKKFVFIIAWLTFNFRPGGKKFNPFGFVPSSVKKNIKKKKFKIPLSLEFISNFSFVFNPPAPFLHICEKTSYPELFKLTKSQLSFSFAIHERKEKSTLNFSFTFNLPFQKYLNFHHHSSSPIQHKLFHQIIHERNNHRIYFQRLSRSLSLFFRSFRESISTFLYPSGAIVRPLSKKGKKGREKKEKKNRESRRWSRTERR